VGGCPKEVREAKEAKEVDHHPVFLTHVFTITLSNIVGAPTFWSSGKDEARQECLGHQKQEKSGPPLNFELSTLYGLSLSSVFSYTEN
jgi:hypothetical protein